MLKQYKSIKAQHRDCILFFRLGDFYEMFFEDAKEASRVLDLVLTSRGKDQSGKIPMCGIPYHSADTYIAKLVKAGYKIAVCEQTEDPAQAKGIVKREVIRVITSGTFIDEHNAHPRYILCLNFNGKTIGLAFTDLRTGTIQTNQYPDKNRMIEIISKLPVYECVFPISAEKTVQEIFTHPLLKSKTITLTPQDDWCFNLDMAQKSLCEHFQMHSLKGFGLDEKYQAISSCAGLLEYLKQMNRQPLRHIDKITIYAESDFVFISPAAHYGLELESLIKTIDRTVTPLGKRAFRYWVSHPLKKAQTIRNRQHAIELLKDHPEIRQELNRLLRFIPDVEKNLSRLSCGYTSAKDLLALRNALARIPELQKVLEPLKDLNIYFGLQDIAELRTLLEKAINAQIPLSNPEGKIIQRGYNGEIDSLRDIQDNGRQWLKSFQEREIKRTKINSLKVGFNRVFGYYIEITKTHLASVPTDYIRKQTLVNGERFITPELKEYEEKILTAEEKILRIEEGILRDLQQKILDHTNALHLFSSTVATLDVLHSLSLLALNNGYVLPEISEDTTIHIREGRHPVVEESSNEPFVPNDTFLNGEDHHLIILTGPNMAGKSTYIRQIAILVIMAQMGSFIPAKSARIGIVDKIFTRIGAKDQITKGQSTFMVEMSEAADILNNLTPRSLVILDEIGRGTSTFDGLSLAWALGEHLQGQKTRTLFATHFHELTALSEEYAGVKNYNVAVKEWQDEIIFLHKIIPGSTDDSYGLYVAKIAGIPQDVITRAKQILTQLELHGNLKDKIRTRSSRETQLPLFPEEKDKTMEEIKKVIQVMDINSLTPLNALNKIQEWKEMIDHHG